MTQGSAFDSWYYQNCCGRAYARDDQWLRFFAGIADRIAADIPASAKATVGKPAAVEGTPGESLKVLDAGCAMGFLVEALRARGVDAEGLDISAYAIDKVEGPARGHCRVASLTDPLPGRYDLVVCIEVLEHMPPADAQAALANLCAHTDDVLFSSSPFDVAEATHVNVLPPEGWAELFARQGFLRDLDYDASYITPWAVRYRRRSETIPRVVREYERAAARLAIERNELRLQVQAFDRDVQTAAADAPRLRLELARVNEELLAAQTRIAALDDTVTHMQQSIFWRLRQLFRGTRSR
jgi:hypothetical protein